MRDKEARHVCITKAGPGVSKRDNPGFGWRANMPKKKSLLQLSLYLAGAFILLAGLAGATFAYLTAVDDPGDAIGYEIVDGNVYVIAASDSKLYRHDLERIGGKAAVFADDLNRWFSGLWRGKKLAYTLALLAIGGSLACFRAAHRASRERGQDGDG